MPRFPSYHQHSSVGTSPHQPVSPYQPAYLDDFFYLQQPPPPLGPMDPCYGVWLRVMHFAEVRDRICLDPRSSSSLCRQARTDYYRAALAYAECFLQNYGWFLPEYARKAFTQQPLMRSPSTQMPSTQMPTSQPTTSRPPSTKPPARN